MTENVKQKIREDGISLRTLYVWLIILAVIITGVVVYATYHLSATFLQLSRAMDEHMVLERAAYELLEASDYLTEKVQRFSIAGKMEYLEDYFTEAFETTRRENAIEKMSQSPNSSAALEKLQEALVSSKSLMEQEFYAMRLVIEAKKIKDYPEVLQTVTLTEEDRQMTPEGKLRRATTLVLSESYYEKKDLVRDKMKESLTELENLTRSFEEASAKTLRSELQLVRTVIILQALGIFVMIWLTSTLGISPVLKAVDRIKDDSPIPEIGANEFRYLARTYNKMYNVYKASVEHLNFKASHDELTKVYNRAGYDLLLSSLDLDTTYMLLFDVDDFKQVNDGYGHETGDRLLIKVANTLRGNFRSDDYVCRIGGDEFVVFMVHSDGTQDKLIASKIQQINRELGQGADGLPPTSISVGIAHGTQCADTAELYEKTDAAMYMAKRNGKHDYRFYRSE